MLRGSHCLISLQDVAIGSDQVADSFRLSCIRIFRRAVGDGDRKVFVTEQIKRESVLLMKFPVLRWRIIADAKNNRIAVAELLDSITEPFTFAGSSRRAGTRIKPEYDVLPGVIFERHGVAILIPQTEPGCFVAGFQHGLTPLRMNECFSGESVKTFAGFILS